MPKPQPRVLRDPVQILEHLLTVAASHYTSVPALVTTDRRGRFESGWVRDGKALRPVGNKSLPLPAKQRNQVTMAALIQEYADHPGHVPGLVHRDDRFPLSIELRLKISRSAQIGFPG